MRRQDAITAFANTNINAAWSGNLHHVDVAGYRSGFVAVTLYPWGIKYQIAERLDGSLGCWRLPENANHSEPGHWRDLYEVSEPLIVDLLSKLYVMVRSRAERR